MWRDFKFFLIQFSGPVTQGGVDEFVDRCDMWWQIRYIRNFWGQMRESGWNLPRPTPVSASLLQRTTTLSPPHSLSPPLYPSPRSLSACVRACSLRQKWRWSLRRGRSGAWFWAWSRRWRQFSSLFNNLALKFCVETSSRFIVSSCDLN